MGNFSSDGESVQSLPTSDSGRVAAQLSTDTKNPGLMDMEIAATALTAWEASVTDGDLLETPRISDMESNSCAGQLHESISPFPLVSPGPPDWPPSDDEQESHTASGSATERLVPMHEQEPELGALVVDRLGPPSALEEAMYRVPECVMGDDRAKMDPLLRLDARASTLLERCRVLLAAPSGPPEQVRKCIVFHIPVLLVS